MATPTSLPATFTSGQVLTAAQMNDLRGAFRILQVVSTTKTDTFSASTDNDGTPNDQFVDVTGLTATITPTSADSKVLVMVDLTASSAGGVGATYRIERDGTPIGVGTSTSNRQAATGAATHASAGVVASGSSTFLDSPASTSALTYGVAVANNESNSSTITVYVNRGQTDTDAAAQQRTTSSITLMEVSA